MNDVGYINSGMSPLAWLCSYRIQVTSLIQGEKEDGQTLLREDGTSGIRSQELCSPEQIAAGTHFRMFILTGSVPETSTAIFPPCRRLCEPGMNSSLVF